VRRWELAPRPDWRARVEAQGCLFHSADDTGRYWGEGAYYELSAAEADAVNAATRELHALCVEAVGAVIAAGRLAELGLGALASELVEASWRARPPSLYGRMDLALGPDGVPRLLEYNADTPTSLLEAGVIQWTWLTDCLPGEDQENRIHDQLIATWRRLAPALGARVHFAFVEDLEDEMTVGYLRDTAEQAGLKTTGLAMADVGWDPARAALVDLAGEEIRALFKLYPWEGLVVDALAPVLPRVTTTWLEPAWKQVLSNKAILPILWELFPGHPNLLPASRTAPREPWPSGVVRKPRLGREGANVSIVAPGVDVTTAGPYEPSGFVYQAYTDLGEHDGQRPVIGSWIIGDQPAGIGIRETAGYVTSNTARFVPHVVR
jgi:glutathionylspermidine synthase